MATRSTMTISLPQEMLRKVEKVSKREFRTKSELVREAVRRYFVAIGPKYVPTKSELKGIKEGRDQIERGEYYTLDEVFSELGSTHIRKGKKGPRKNRR